MSRLGLQGKSLLPILVSLGCTVSGAEGARVIDSRGQRILTIALAWSVPCGATWAVIPAFARSVFGWRAVFVIAAVLTCVPLHMLVTSAVFGRALARGEKRGMMIMELPPMHRPRLGTVVRTALRRTGSVIVRTFVIIFCACGLFCVLSYPAADGTSLASIAGGALEGITRFFGLGWRAFFAFLSSGVSREAALGTLDALFAEGVKMSRPEALAFIFAVTFNIPCVSAVSVTRQEIGSFKWTFAIAAWYFAAALALAFLAYHAGLLLSL